MMSASDPEGKCCEFVKANSGKLTRLATHWFKTMDDQRKGCPCILHPFANTCRAAPEEVDLALVGTPCHPYSTQRADRYKESSVQSHHEFDIAMDGFLQWLETFEPKNVIFEQVMGFDKPLQAGSEDTPYKMFLD